MHHLIKYSRPDDRDLSNPGASVITLCEQLFFLYLEMEAEGFLENTQLFIISVHSKTEQMKANASHALKKCLSLTLMHRYAFKNVFRL
jgi:hypothetical protein